MKMQKWFGVVLGLVGIMTGFAQASVIYSDDFSGSGSASLNGTSPDVTTNGATWAGLTTGTQWMNNGTIVTNATTTRRDMFLPFIPEAGKVYTAKIDVVRLSTLSDFFEFGFVTNAVYTGGFPLATSGLGASPWMASYSVNGNVGTWTGPNADGSGTQVAVANADAFNTLEMVLDTTKAAWTVDFILNGTTIRTETLSSNPDIHYIGFGRYGGGSFQVDNFELSVVPEPVSIGLTLLGGILLLMVRRRVGFRL